MSGSARAEPTDTLTTWILPGTDNGPAWLDLSSDGLAAAIAALLAHP